MSEAIVVEDDGFGGAAYRRGIAYRVRMFNDGQVEVNGWQTTLWRKLDFNRTLARAKRGESLMAERNREIAAQRAKKRVRQLCKAISADRMVTLTTRRLIADLDEFQKLFDQFRRLMRKHRDFAYVAVPELQKRGAWHLHIAMHGKIARNLVIRLWLKVCGGKGHGFAHISNPRGAVGRAWEGHRLASYISKYISKDMDQRELNAKRYWASRGIAIPEGEVVVTFGTWDALPSIHDILTDVLASMSEAVGIADLVAYVSAPNGAFWLATGPRDDVAVGFG